MIPEANTLTLDSSTESTDNIVTRDFSLTVSPGLFEAVARRAAELVAQESKPDPYLNAEQATEYLACPLSRIYALVSAGRIPHYHEGSRLLFRRSELDEWVRNGGAKRP